ncbi:MAG: c-type cytochrome [Candidatus Eiseniibacteriota bacterium]
MRVRSGMWWAAGWTAIVLAGGVFALSCARTEGNGGAGGPAGSSATPAQMTAEEKIARGKYVATIAGCGDCHTPGTLYGAPDESRSLAGSELGWAGPWGVSYARNLTPDMETGIGAWSEDDIVKAVRTGQRPDGSPLLPPMPWPNYGHMTDEDAYALAAYLKSLPAVSHKNPAIVPPGKTATGAVVPIPAPPAWDAPKGPPPGSAGSAPPSGS